MQAAIAQGQARFQLLRLSHLTPRSHSGEHCNSYCQAQHGADQQQALNESPSARRCNFIGGVFLPAVLRDARAFSFQGLRVHVRSLFRSPVFSYANASESVFLFRSRS